MFILINVNKEIAPPNGFETGHRKPEVHTAAVFFDFGATTVLQHFSRSSIVSNQNSNVLSYTKKSRGLYRNRNRLVIITPIYVSVFYLLKLIADTVRTPSRRDRRERERVHVRISNARGRDGTSSLRAAFAAHYSGRKKAPHWRETASDYIPSSSTLSPCVCCNFRCVLYLPLTFSWSIHTRVSSHDSVLIE